MTTEDRADATGQPKRIQRKRSKGWRMPKNTIYVGRPSVFENRWKIGVQSNALGREVRSAEEAVALFRDLSGWATEAHMRGYVRERLEGKNLACWCPLDQPCHADVLLEIANGPTP